MTHRTLRSLLHGVAFGLACVVSSAGWAEDKAIFQVTDADEAKWNLVLANVRNLQRGTEASGGVDVEIVAFGPGITMLKQGSPIAARVSEAVGNHVKVVACKNTMAASHLSESDMLTDIGFVPSGVVEVMHKEQQGYAYIRP